MSPSPRHIWDEPIEKNQRRDTRAASNASATSSVSSNNSSGASSSPSNDDPWYPESSPNNHDRRDDGLIYVLVPVIQSPSEFGPVDDLPNRQGAKLPNVFWQIC